MAIRRAVRNIVSTIKKAALDSSTVAYVNAVIAAGYTPGYSFTRDVDTLIKALKAGVTPPWDNYDVIMLYAVPDKKACLDLKTPTRAVSEFNSPTFTADRGYSGNGTNSYTQFSPAYNPGLGGALLTQNDMHIGVYSLTAGANGNYHFGTTFTNTIRVKGRTDTNSGASLAVATGISSTGTHGMPVHAVGIRRSSTTQRIFVEGIQSNSSAVNSSALASASWGALRTNSSDYSTAQVAIVHAGKAHSDDQALQEHNAMKEYLRARGAL
ncbi:hypothetical protein [Rhizobium phage RHEph16]|uniref:Uncharacterized protein n=1 Tax=Rhizobium phage RHEph16 TaxID=2836132 RepID=A0AAE8AW09_9CAUD|nr:hypothetical protein PP750_gp37 [Rhizobium phage RHEph16]QXV74346.1 hypothetical protein [Rhizobium phage RHEph16]